MSIKRGVGRGFFVAGTDTGVGKTLVACGLLRAFAAFGMAVAGMKPVEAGQDGGRSDVERLAAASTVQAARELANPYVFRHAIAPHIAASLEGAEIDLNVIVGAYQALSKLAQLVIVEGIGGYLVPLNGRDTGADLAVRLGLPVVLVVGMRLGCLNHALLTRREIERSRLPCAGWVANCIMPEMAFLDENIHALSERLDCPLVGIVPNLRKPTASQVAAVLSLDRLCAV